MILHNFMDDLSSAVFLEVLVGDQNMVRKRNLEKESKTHSVCHDDGK